jgi:hypothetical protein
MRNVCLPVCPESRLKVKDSGPLARVGAGSVWADTTLLIGPLLPHSSFARRAQ